MQNSCDPEKQTFPDPGEGDAIVPLHPKTRFPKVILKLFI
jgi:hypothetical protein